MYALGGLLGVPNPPEDVLEYLQKRYILYSSLEYRFG
jgi:hypothetical protein